MVITATSNVAYADNILDARQESQIWTTYALSPYLRALDIKVSVKDGKAVLTGKANEEVNRDLAKQIALGVKGIREVDNQIVVQADYVKLEQSSERSFGELVDDATIVTAVKSKLLWNKHTDGLSIDVDSKNSRVTLKGNADSGVAKELARSLALNTHGVRSVRNELVVVEPKKTKTSEQVFADGWITTKVKSTFMYSKNVNGSDISVSTADGVVTLSGTLDSGAERELAIELAQNIRGVQSVKSKGLILHSS
jgi:osmotically-inducible protein OsmY